jgi:hypothetical protein
MSPWSFNCPQMFASWRGCIVTDVWSACNPKLVAPLTLFYNKRYTRREREGEVTEAGNNLTCLVELWMHQNQLMIRRAETGLSLGAAKRDGSNARRRRSS